MATSSEAIGVALGYRQTGRLTEAERVCREILAVDSEHVGALGLLGEMACLVGDFSQVNPRVLELWAGVLRVAERSRLVLLAPVGRAGVSLNSNLGLPELIAESPEQYLRIALELAGNWTRLKSLREELRERMLASPLMDARRFARNVEVAYRSMWQRYCDAAST